MKRNFGLLARTWAQKALLRQTVKRWSIPVDWKPIVGPTRLGAAQPITPRPGPSGPPDEGRAAVARTDGYITEYSIHMGVISVLDSMRVIGEKLASLPGRKNLVWVTAGFPPRYLHSMNDETQHVVEQLNDANIALNAIDVRGRRSLTDPQASVLQTLSESTGGKAWLNNDISAAIREADAAAHTNYTLGFYLADNERDGNFHELKLRVDRAGVNLSYRKGYVAEKVPGGRPDKETPETELLNPVDAAAIHISGTADVAPGEPHPTLHLKLALDPRNLTLRPKKNGMAFKVARMFTEMDARGATLVEGHDTKEIAVPTTSSVYLGTMCWEQSLPLMPGAAKVRVVIRDEATGHTGTLTVPVPAGH